MDSYCVYLDGVLLKAFSGPVDAFTLSNGLEIFLLLHDMDRGLVKVVKEVL